MRFVVRTVPVLLALAGCSQQLGATHAPEEAGPPVADNLFVEGTLPTGFLEAADLTSVPGELLIAIANAETSMQTVQGEVEFDGLEPKYGVMGLTADLVTEAAALSGYTEQEIRDDRVANVVATAMLLESWAEETGADTTSLGGWAPIVATYSGIEDPEAVAEYVHYEVYATLEDGLGVEGLELKPQPLDIAWPAPARSLERVGDSGAVWTASPNNSSRGGVTPSYVVIHTCEGSYSSCWSWLANSASGVSAHYVVNSTGSEVRHLVDEARKAWHIAANYSCSNNSNRDCFRNGAAMNTHSVGIEHAGYASQTSWNSGQIQRSAALTCGITQRHGIPIDRYHVFGHGQMQPWNRTDPGANWPWATYMAKIEQACGSTPTPPEPPAPDPTDPTPAPTPTGTSTIIDSNNNANDTSRYYVEVSSNWWASANVSGHYNTGYWVAPTEGVSDAAAFNFQADQTQCYRVDAWWPAAGDRPSGVVWLGWNAQGNEVGRKTVNQRIDGGRWNTLGTWRFTQGWNKILLSRWTTPGDYAVADAVRITPSTCN